MLKFENISVDIQSRHPFTRRIQQQRQILKNVSGCAKPGRILGILGPSGSGKTTLLNVLAKSHEINHYHGISGHISLNQQPLENLDPKIYRKKIGYVPQEGHYLESLTVEQLFHIQAYLKLPSNLSKKEIKEKIGKQLSELNLEHVQYTNYGGEMVRGLSGGEKKRVCLGMELISAPEIILLDEPTSGLSSKDALQILKLLKYLANQSHTIILTIHQPRSEIFRMLDDILVLRDGQVVMNCPIERVEEEIYNQVGEICPSGYNLGDFLLDRVEQLFSVTATTTFTTNTKPKKEKLTIVTDSWVSTETLVDSSDVLEVEPSTPLLAPRDVFTFPPTTPSIAVHPAVNKKEKADQFFFRQLYILTYRNMIYFLRHPMLLLTSIVFHIVFGLLTGYLFGDLQRDTETIAPRFQTTIGVFWIGTFCAFFSIVQLPHLVREKYLYKRESFSGLYSPFAYFLARLVTDLLYWTPLCFLFTLPSLFLTNLVPADQMPPLLLLMWLFEMVAVSLVSIIAVLSQNAEGAQILITAVNTLSMMMDGFLVDYSSLPQILKGFYWISSFQYLFTGLSLEVFKSEKLVKGVDVNRMTVLYLGLEDRTYMGVVYALIVFVVVYRLASFVVLWLMSRPRRHSQSK